MPAIQRPGLHHTIHFVEDRIPLPGGIHEGFHPAPRFCLDLDLEKTRSPESFEFTTRGAYVFTRCGSLEEAKPLALKSISLGDVARIRFDPDLVELRELPEVRQALEH